MKWHWRKFSSDFLRVLPRNHQSTIAVYSSIKTPELCDGSDEAAKCHIFAVRFSAHFPHNKRSSGNHYQSHRCLHLLVTGHNTAKRDTDRCLWFMMVKYTTRTSILLLGFECRFLRQPVSHVNTRTGSITKKKMDRRGWNVCCTSTEHGYFSNSFCYFSQAISLILKITLTAGMNFLRPYAGDTQEDQTKIEAIGRK
jgi:hypothetical protein